jgi:hypothetical protein
MSMALCFGFALSFAGQIITHRLQPVQSSGATWIEYFLPLNSLPLKSIDLNVAGALAASEGSNTFARIAACGQTNAHLLHWMQIFSSHAGISSAIARFSHCAVPVGQVPSTGKADTGSRSPLPSMIVACTRCTKSGACAGTAGRIFRVPVGWPIDTSKRFSSVWSTAAKLRLTTSAPFLPYVFSIAFLIWAIASSRGRTPEIAKKQVCMTPLMRLPMPVSSATL